VALQPSSLPVTARFSVNCLFNRICAGLRFVDVAPGDGYSGRDWLVILVEQQRLILATGESFAERGISWWRFTDNILWDQPGLAGERGLHDLGPRPWPPDVQGGARRKDSEHLLGLKRR
jgi:hypothetical protein